MKKIIFWVTLLTAAFIVVGCTSTSPRVTGTPATYTGSTLTDTEQKTYANALKQLKKGEIEQAEKALIKLAQLHRGNFSLWINLANAHYQTKSFEAASNALSQADSIKPNTPEAHNLSGLIAVEEQDYKAAEQHYLKALSLNKNYPSAHYNLALLYDIFYQDIRSAITHYQLYLTLIPEEDTATASWVEELKLSLKRRSNG